MAGAWTWENGDRIQLEDGSGVWLLEGQSGGGGGGGNGSHGGGKPPKDTPDIINPTVPLPLPV